jgi:hypothetical protein
MKFSGLMPKLARSLGLVSLCVVSAMAAEPKALSADEKLAAIRQGLLEAALEGPTQVQATQWIDDKGALRETSSYRNGMQVRGVRVLGYTQDATGKPNATLQWQSVPDRAITNVSGAARVNGCRPSASGRLQHVVSLNWIEGEDWRTDDLALLLSLRRLLAEELRQAGSSSAVWRLSQQPPSAAARSSYEQALLGGADEELPWQLRINLQQLPVITQARPFGTWTDAPIPKKIAATMTLGARGLGKALRQGTITLDLEAAATNNWLPAQWTKASSEQISRQAQQWAIQLETELSCQPMVAKVTQVIDNQIRINAGASAGLRVGDEWLLADGQHVLDRTLEASLTPHTVLAKVIVVAENHAQLATVAGAIQAVRHNWIGWTTEGSR